MDHQLVRLMDYLAARRQMLWTAACAAFLLPFSLYIMLTFVFGSDFMGMGGRSLEAMMHGNALKPHVYRQLVPAMARGIIAATPDTVQESISTALHEALWQKNLLNEAVKMRHRYGVPRELRDQQLYPLFVVTLLDYAFLLGYIYLLWRLARQLYPELFAAHILAPLIGAIALPVFCGKFGYIYDFPVLFFSALLTWLLLNGRLYLFSFFLALATYNKESAVYLVLLFILYGYRTLPFQTYVFFSAVQLLLFALVKLALTLQFAHLPDDPFFGSSLMTHLRFSLSGYSIYTFLGFGAVLAAFSYRWYEKPLILRCWMAILPLMGIAWLLLGNRAEYRVFYDIFPCFSLLAAHTFATALRWEKA